MICYYNWKKSVGYYCLGCGLMRRSDQAASMLDQAEATTIQAAALAGLKMGLLQEAG